MDRTSTHRDSWPQRTDQDIAPNKTEVFHIQTGRRKMGWGKHLKKEQTKN